MQKQVILLFLLIFNLNLLGAEKAIENKSDSLKNFPYIKSGLGIEFMTNDINTRYNIITVGFMDKYTSFELALYDNIGDPLIGDTPRLTKMTYSVNLHFGEYFYDLGAIPFMSAFAGDIIFRNTMVGFGFGSLYTDMSQSFNFNEATQPILEFHVEYYRIFWYVFMITQRFQYNYTFGTDNPSGSNIIDANFSFLYSLNIGFGGY